MRTGQMLHHLAPGQHVGAQAAQVVRNGRRGSLFDHIRVDAHALVALTVAVVSDALPRLQTAQGCDGLVCLITVLPLKATSLR